MAEPHLAAIADALAQAVRRQGVVRVADLDFADLAAAVAGLSGDAARPAVTPLDPEGDGLTPTELNAANDG